MPTCVFCHTPFTPLPLLDGKVMSACCSDECVDAEKARRKLDPHGNPLPARAPGPAWCSICPPRYACFDAERLPPRGLAVADSVLAWNPRTTPGHGIALIGPSDTGKSMLIHEAARRAFARGHHVFITCAAEFAWQAADFDARRPYLQRCLSAPVLVFDDVGKSKLTERVESDFFHILDHRERWRLPLLWTANTHGDDLKATMTEDRADPILNRLRRSATVLVV